MSSTDVAALLAGLVREYLDGCTICKGTRRDGDRACASCSTRKDRAREALDAHKGRA